MRRERGSVRPNSCTATIIDVNVPRPWHRSCKPCPHAVASSMSNSWAAAVGLAQPLRMAMGATADGGAI